MDVSVMRMREATIAAGIWLTFGIGGFGEAYVALTWSRPHRLELALLFALAVAAATRCPWSTRHLRTTPTTACRDAWSPLETSQSASKRQEEHKRDVATLACINRVEEALAEDRFVLYAQPIIDLTGATVQHELLLRMLDRDGQVVAPETFFLSPSNTR